MMTVATTMTLRNRGFMQSLAQSERAYGSTVKRMAAVGAAEFGKGAAAQAGAMALATIWSRFTQKKQPARGPAGIVEGITGIDPSDPVGARHRLKSVLAAGATAVVAFGIAGIRSADRIKDLAEQSDLSTDAIQRLDIAATKSGQSVEKMLGFLENIGQARRDAAKDETTRGIFQSFGVSTAAALGPKSNLEIAQMMAGSLGSGPLSSKRKNELRAIGGARAERLVGALRELGSGAEGPIAAERDVSNIQSATQSLKMLGREVSVAGATAVGGVIDRLKQFGNTRIGQELLRRGGHIKENLLGALAGLPRMTFGGLLPSSPATSGEVLGPPAELAGPLKEALYRDEVAIERQAQAADAYTKSFQSAQDLQFEQMSATEKETELRRRINVALVAATHHDPGTKERAEAITEANELKSSLVQLLRSQIIPMQHDDLARVGGFTGAAGNNTGLNYLQKIAAATEGMANSMRGEGGGGLP